MGQVLHGSATTTEAVRRTIQNSQASVRALARGRACNPGNVRLEVLGRPDYSRVIFSTYV